MRAQNQLLNWRPFEKMVPQEKPRCVLSLKTLAFQPFQLPLGFCTHTKVNYEKHEVLLYSRTRFFLKIRNFYCFDVKEKAVFLKIYAPPKKTDSVPDQKGLQEKNMASLLTTEGCFWATGGHRGGREHWFCLNKHASYAIKVKPQLNLPDTRHLRITVATPLTYCRACLAVSLCSPFPTMGVPIRMVVGTPRRSFHTPPSR